MKINTHPKKLLTAVVSTLCLTSSALALDCEHPDDQMIFKGYNDLKVECDQSFIGAVQGSVASGPFATLGVVSSYNQSGTHVAAIPAYLNNWSQPLGLDQVQMRTFAKATSGGPIALTPTKNIPECNGERVFQEENEYVIMEMEHGEPTGSWQLEHPAGHTGAGVLCWRGSNHYNQPGNGILRFPFEITTPGQYRLVLRSYRESSGHEENDVWVRTNGDSWVKVYSHRGGGFNWTTQVDPGHGGYKRNLGVGRHVLELSGRSRNFCIDRVFEYNKDTYSSSFGQNDAELGMLQSDGICEE